MWEFESMLFKLDCSSMRPSDTKMAPLRKTWCNGIIGVSVRMGIGQTDSELKYWRKPDFGNYCYAAYFCILAKESPPVYSHQSWLCSSWSAVRRSTVRAVWMLIREDSVVQKACKAIYLRCSGLEWMSPLYVGSPSCMIDAVSRYRH